METFAESAKGADARAEARKEFANQSRRASDTAPVLRGFLKNPKGADARAEAGKEFANQSRRASDTTPVLRGSLKSQDRRSLLSARLPGVLTLLLLSAFACNASNDATSAPAKLTGTSWQLLKFTGSDGQTLSVTDPAKYTISFDNDAFSMRIDCNRGHGSWESSEPNRLKFGPLLLTRAMCPPDPLNDRIPKDWTDIRSYTIKENHLFLSLKDNGGTYEFQPMLVLENTHWKLTRLGDAPVPQSQPEPYLTLEADTHRFTGSGGCNRFSGSYELDGNHLDFGQRVASTMMMCAKGMETETRFLGVLANVKTWSIAGQELKLSDGGGNVLATLEAASR